MKDDIIILVDSFDGYSDLWEPFFEVFNHFWPDCEFKTVLVSNQKDFKKIETIKTGPEISWTHRTLKAIEQTKSKYVMLLLEDYLLGDYVENRKILECINFLEKNNGKYLRLTNIPASRFNGDDKEVFPLYADEEYAINLQASIWEREFLIESLKKFTGNAWDFELGFLAESKKSEHIELDGCFGIQNDPLNIHNGVLKGKWFPSSLRYYKKKGFVFSWKKRGKLSFIEELKYNITVFVKNRISYDARIKIKGWLKKIGFKFVSDF